MVSAVVLLLTQQGPSLLLDRVVPLLLVYAIMPPPAAATDRGSTTAAGSRVRETKRALLGRSNGAGCGRSRTSVSRSPCTVAAPFVAKGTVSKISEKFQSPPAPPSPPKRTITATTRIPKLQQQQEPHSSGRGALPRPPLPPLPPPVVKYEIKRRQEKLLGELHRRRIVIGSSVSGRLPVGGGADSAMSSDCGSSSDSEKSVCFGGPITVAAVADALNEPDKPGSPHSSGYESVEETNAATAADDDDPTSAVATAVPYSWVFGECQHDGFETVLSSSSSSSSSSDGCYVDDGPTTTGPEDRLERFVTFASLSPSPSTSCPALTCAKRHQDDGDDHGNGTTGMAEAAAVRRRFAGNDVAMPVQAVDGYLSPIPECPSTEPNSVETVEDCVYTGNKVRRKHTPPDRRRRTAIGWA